MKKNTNFYNYGTYKLADANILKQELEKTGIPTKRKYPGTNIGTETYANAEFQSYQIMIKACDYEQAENIRKILGINPIQTGEEMPFVPKSFANWSRLIIIEIAILFIGMGILSIFENKLEDIAIIKEEGARTFITDAYSEITIIFFSLSLVIILITVFTYVLRSIKKWFKGEKI